MNPRPSLPDPRGPRRAFGPLTIGAATVLFVLAAGLTFRLAFKPHPAVGRPGSGPPPKLAERLKDRVFPVRAYTPEPVAPGRVRVEYGSCVAVGRGTFLTAAHVVRPAGESTRVVVLAGERELAVEVTRVSDGFDAAVLSAPDHDGPVFRLSTDRPAPGAPVYAAGFPVKFSGAALPRLVVTAGRLDDPAFPSPLAHLHTGSVLRVIGATDLGGSGGALVGADGTLLGLVFGSRFVGDEATHLYAVPATDLAPLLRD